MDAVVVLLTALVSLKAIGILQSLRWLRRYNEERHPFPTTATTPRAFAQQTEREVLSAYENFTSVANARFFPFGLKNISLKVSIVVDSSNSPRLSARRILLAVLLRLRFLSAASFLAVVLTAILMRAEPITLLRPTEAAWVLVVNSFMLLACVPLVSLEALLSYAKTSGYASTLHMHNPPPPTFGAAAVLELETLVGTTVVALGAAIQGTLVIGGLMQGILGFTPISAHTTASGIFGSITEAAYTAVATLLTATPGRLAAHSMTGDLLMMAIEVCSVALAAMVAGTAIWVMRVHEKWA